VIKKGLGLVFFLVLVGVEIRLRLVKKESKSRFKVVVAAVIELADGATKLTAGLNGLDATTAGLKRLDEAVGGKLNELAAAAAAALEDDTTGSGLATTSHPLK
jgi:hypothetical protein